MSNRSISFVQDKKIWDAENVFYLNAKTSRISKFVYHYEIYKKIIDIPGDILEFGVFKGASFSKLLAFRKILENQDSRKIVGFDDFGSFTVKGTKEDKQFARDYIKNFGKGVNADSFLYKLIKDFLEKKSKPKKFSSNQSLALHNISEIYLKQRWFSNLEVFCGDILELRDELLFRYR